MNWRLLNGPQIWCNRLLTLRPKRRPCPAKIQVKRKRSHKSSLLPSAFCFLLYCLLSTLPHGWVSAFCFLISTWLQPGVCGADTNRETVSTVSFINPIQPIFLYKYLELLDEAFLAMVLFLMGDVCSHPIDVRMRNGKCSVTAAPGEFPLNSCTTSSIDLPVGRSINVCT